MELKVARLCEKVNEKHVGIFEAKTEQVKSSCLKVLEICRARLGLTQEGFEALETALDRW